MSALVAMTRADEVLSAWYTPPHLLGDELTMRQYPHGNLNCGVAHGIPGSLALMALALTADMDTPGLQDSVEQIARWLITQRLDDVWGASWPAVVPLTAAGQVAEPVTSRTAWCYGTPGVARSLWLAGKALNQPRFCEQAIEAMPAVYRRPERGMDSPTFCHGVAGLLQITLRFGHDTGHSLFAVQAATLVAQLLGLYEPNSLLGYRDHELGGRLVDRPGLLDGAPGVALALLAA
jgi:lantibiotic biosynthesis protein